MKPCILIILFTLVYSSLLAQDVSHDKEKKFTLNVNWRFVQSDSSNWLPASVPGCIHTDLFRNGIIPDPLIGTNESKCQWIGEKNWIYETEPFDLDTAILNSKIFRLRFNGLDTYAEVYINNINALNANNAFRSWEIDATEFLREKDNIIRILFRSPVTEGEKRIKQLGYTLPYEAVRAVTRKPQYNYGWDWGPKLVTCGITRPVEIIAFNEVYIRDIYIQQDKVNENNASLKAFFEIESTSDMVSDMMFSYDEYTNWTTPVELYKGINRVELSFDIPWPNRWWCNDFGEPYLYTFSAILSKNNEIKDQKQVKTGLRSIELITKKDSIGSAFFFEINKKPVFIKGANYIPISVFPATASPDNYRKLLQKCRDAHFNMLRVWGGGLYEEELFYSLCDEMGIMVWQDFMFACAMYPGDPAFLDNVTKEAHEQTVRLRNHPCLALWCGNNENAEGWVNWGWQMDLDEKNKLILENAYSALFDQILPDAVHNNTTTDYWESSPLYGRGDKKSLTEGDAHYWGLWHDAEDFEALRKKIPRFMSEFGMQSYPSYAVLKEIPDNEVVSPDNPGFVQHQKHSRGFDLMDQYMRKWYPAFPKEKVEKYGELTQAVQAEGMCMGIEAQRRASPRCMGTLYWQLNDVWPAFSWSSIDYRGNEKLFFTMLQESYSPQLITWYCTKDSLNLYWINDNAIPVESNRLKIEFYNADQLLINTVDSVLVQLHSGVQKIYSDYIPTLLMGASPEDHYMIVCLYDANAKMTYSRTMKLVPTSKKYLIPQKNIKGIGVGLLR